MKTEIVFDSQLNEMKPTGYDEMYVDEAGMTHVIGDWNKMDNVLPFQVAHFFIFIIISIMKQINFIIFNKYFELFLEIYYIIYVND